MKCSRKTLFAQYFTSLPAADSDPLPGGTSHFQWTSQPRGSGPPRMKPRILVLTMHYRPEPNFITADVAAALGGLGSVTVVTAHPNYPFGRFYKGVRPWRPRASIENGVRVWRLPFIADHSVSTLRRGLSYLSFAIAAALVAPVVGGRPAVVWVYQSPFTTALAALWFRWVIRVPVVYTSADLWPESLGATAVLRPGRLMRALYAYSRWINRQADLIICSTRGTLDRYKRDGIPDERLAHVPVWVDGIPDAVDGNISPRESPRSIVYAGNLGPAQSLATLIRAAALIKREAPNITFDLYGAGASEDELRSLATELEATNVRFHGRVDAPEAFRASAAALAQVVSLAKTPLFRMTVPSKLPFAIAAGAPLLYALEGEAAKIASESGLGIPFDSDDPSTLVDAVRRAAGLTQHDRETMQERADAYFRRSFARAALLERYLRLFARVVRPSRGAIPSVPSGRHTASEP